MASENLIVIQDLGGEQGGPGRDDNEANRDTGSKLTVSVEPSITSSDTDRNARLDIIESRIRGVLNTRPSIRLAKKSRPILVDEPLSRNDATRHTLPSRVQKRADQPAAATLRTNQLRKPSIPVSISLNEGLSNIQRNNSTDILISTDDSTCTEKETKFFENKGANEVPLAIVVQDGNNQVTEVEEVNPNSLSTLKRFGRFRKSAMYLKYRIQKRHQETVNIVEADNKVVNAGCFSDWKYVKWPKVKSWLQVQLSRRLWKSHLKEVEGHFGTAVVSYFIFLRWLFIMNLLIFMLWFSIICIPEIVLVSSRNLNATSETSCVFETPNDNNYTCSRSTELVFGFIRNNCTTEVEDMFVVQSCSFNNDGVAVRESGNNEITVSRNAYDIDCQEAEIENETLIAYPAYSLCPNVDPHIEWYTYIADFISGTGIFNETILFHGVYRDSPFGGFDFDLAFIFMVGLIYVISVILLVYKMGHAFNESYVEFGTKRQVNHCNKLFTAWDFNISNPKTANLKKTHIKTDFKEELVDINARETKRTVKEMALVVFIRIWTNFFVLISLIGAGAAIYYSAIFELALATNENTGVTIIAEYLSAIVLTLLNAIYPFVFSLVARLERYKTPSGAVTITLIRTILVRLSSLLVLLSSLYNVISRCTRVVEPEDEDLINECTFSTLTGNFLSNTTELNSNEACPICWETFIGQQFFRLALTNLFVSLVSTIVLETGRNFASHVAKRIEYKRIGTLLRKVVKKGNFNIPKSILDLIYTQSLLWLGFLFSPLLPTIVLLTSFCLFYVKKYSLLFNLEPDKKGLERSSKTNFLSLFLMLLALFAAAIPVLYAVTQLKPSDSCGPFRGQDTMYQSISLLIDKWSCPAQIAADFLSSAAFVVPLVIFLLLLLYAMYVVLKARNARFQLIKKQLFLEGANVAHIVGHLDSVLTKLADERRIDNAEVADAIKRYSALQSPQYIEKNRMRYSKAMEWSQSKQ